MNKKTEKVKTQSWNESFAAFQVEESKVIKPEEKAEETKQADNAVPESFEGSSSRIYIMNIPFNIQDIDLRKVFSKYG